MDESRKRFEQWALEVMQFTPDELTWDEERNCYRDYVPHMAWKSWQASRVAIEIELPKLTRLQDWTGNHQIPNEYPKLCVDAIRAAGIKVKE
ncbi:hypothetical protein ACNKJC_000727 [Enterobacter hormaechei]